MLPYGHCLKLGETGMQMSLVRRLVNVSQSIIVWRSLRLAHVRYSSI